jgi:hypothetical protein
MTSSPSPRQSLISSPTLWVAVVGALFFGGWLNAHLGDFTAERGWRALMQVAAISLAFGAMIHLIVEGIVRAVLGLQNDLDALTGARERRQSPHDRS